MFSQSHSNWLQTVASHPEAISFKLVPITSLLSGVPGSGYLSHAINLYLRCEYAFFFFFLFYTSNSSFDFFTPTLHSKSLVTSSCGTKHCA